jgi:type II secretory ATPase GspE/PulE/Tfp pilus assembly ATPase PilB-like protein
MFKKAIDIGSSDIHIEPTEFFLLIRFRKDGDFLLYDKIHRDNMSSIITRLKVLSKIKIDENKKPQDGKIVYMYEKESKNIDIRLSSLPTNY